MNGNKGNKVSTHIAVYEKVYIQTKDKVYSRSKELLNRMDIWYSGSKVREVYTYLRGLELLKLQVIKETTTKEKVKLNQEVRRMIKKLEIS